MIVMAGCALLSAWVLGGLIVIALWPRERAVRKDLTLILPLGAIVGLGATSMTFFFASLVSAQPALLAGAIECIIALALICVTARRDLRATSLERTPMTWLDWTLATLCVQTAVVATIIARRAYLTEPYGGWDGWAIWNMHARFMLRAGTEWPELLAAPQLNWTHPDYPRLLPASVARVWAWAGNEIPAAPALVSAAFAAAVVGLLMAFVSRVRGRTIALLGGLLLLGTPFFVTFSSNEHADIPLASFLLAAVALAAIGERWMLAGLCAGLAAWTKNEGLLFAIVFATVCGVREWRRGSLASVGRILGGLALGLLPVFYFKLQLAPPNDLLAAPLGPRLANAAEFARHRTIATALWRDIARFGEWHLIPFLAMALPFVAWRWRRALPGNERILPVVLLAMLAGYYGVYVLSPHDLAWHLDTSLVRLLLQLWPLALAAWCLALPAPKAEPVRATRQTTTRAVFVVANVLAAAALMLGLSGQLAANELAIKRTRAGIVTATLGEGWFGLERNSRDTWVWSGGQATLQLHAPKTVHQVTLRFSVRSFGQRTVSIRMGDRILWERHGADTLVPVALTGLTFPAGVTTLDFATETAGSPESGEAGARTLAFAIYNLKFE